MERIIPQDLNAEKAVIGSMFLSKYALQKGLETLTADIFYLDNHNKIFTVIKDLSDKGAPIDVTTVSSELSNRGWLKTIGDVDYLAAIINGVPSASNIEFYIKIIVDKSLLRKLINEANDIANAAYDTSNDVGNVVDNAEKKILGVCKIREGTEFRSIQDVLFKTQADLEKLAELKGEVTGLATGFYDIDKVTSGLQPNQLIIIAARPAMGKTTFAVNLATNVAMNSKKAVALFNLEMGAEQLATLMLASVGQIDGYKLRSGHLLHDDWKRVNEAISRLADTKIFIDDTPGITIGEIKAKCRRLASSSDGLAIVIIDYLQLISGGGNYGANRQQEVSDISRSLKTLAMELSVPVVALAQLSRSVEARDDKRPILSDLRESGSIEQDADIVAFLYREDYYKKELAIDEFTSKSEFIIGKHRSGPTATIDLIFKRNTQTFVNFVNKEEK